MKIVKVAFAILGLTLVSMVVWMLASGVLMSVLNIQVPQ